MGINYYVKLKDRKVNQKDLHIGKKSIGWEFSFQGYDLDDYYNTPKLKSKKEWFEYLFLNSDLIYNEDDKNISFLEFANMVNNSKNNENLNHYDYISKSINDYNIIRISKETSELIIDGCYKDKEGFSISLYDFE